MGAKTCLLTLVFVLHCSACMWSDESGKISELEKIDSIKTLIHQLANEVVSHMTGVHLGHTATPYTATLLRVVDDISSRHEIVFESIVRRLGLDRSPNYNACKRTISGVGNELFADGQYNWGRTVTMFAFTGWLARSCCRNSGNICSSSNNCLTYASIIADVAGEYMGEKLSQWIYLQGGMVSDILLLCVCSIFILLIVC